MKLYSTPTSPFVRIVRMVALEKGLDDRIELFAARDPEAALGSLNPLDKVPTLTTDDGETLIESRLIAQYLDDLGGAPHLYPDDPARRRAVLQKEAVILGMMDATSNRRQELRRPDTGPSAWWVERQMKKITRGLDRIEGDIEGYTDAATVVPFELLSALEFLDRLTPEVPEYEWRPAHPKLAAWHADFATRPSVADTRPQEG